MTDDVTVLKPQKPFYKSYAADPADIEALKLNGGGAIPITDATGNYNPEKPLFPKPIEDTAEAAQENADELGEFISKVCREAVEKSTAGSLNAINEKIQSFQTVSLQYVNQIETVAKLKEEALNMKMIATNGAADTAVREAAVNVAMANQTVSLRTLLAGSLITSSLVWIYTIYDPEPTRIAAAGACSLLMLGPLVALYWRKG